MAPRRGGIKGLAPRHNKQAPSIQPSKAEASFPVGEYMVPASDAMGRSVTITCSAAPQTKRIASVILAKGLFGFKTQEDIWRYCIDKGLIHLSDHAKDDDIAGQAAMIVGWSRVAKHELEYSFYVNHLRSVQKALVSMINRGDGEKAKAVAEQIWREHDKLQDPYWRAKYRKMAKQILDLVRERGSGDDND